MNTSSPSHTFPAVECAPWCQVGDGHTDVLGPEDQWCHSVSDDVYLSRRSLVRMTSGTWQQDRLEVRIERDSGARDPHIALVDETQPPQVPLSIREARDLAAKINRACDIAEATDAGPLTQRLAQR